MAEDVTPEQQAIQDKRDLLSRIEGQAQLRQDDDIDALSRERRRRRIGWLTAFLGAIGGVVIGGYIGRAIAPSPDPNAMLDLSALDWVFWGAIIGFFVGPLVGLMAGWATAAVWEYWRAGRPADPSQTRMVEFDPRSKRER